MPASIVRLNVKDRLSPMDRLANEMIVAARRAVDLASQNGLEISIVIRAPSHPQGGSFRFNNKNPDGEHFD